MTTPQGARKPDEQQLSTADVDCLLTATAMLGFLMGERPDLAQELAEGTPDEVLVNGQLHISRFLLDGLSERADMEPSDVLDSIREQALQRHVVEPAATSGTASANTETDPEW